MGLLYIAHIILLHIQQICGQAGLYKSPFAIYTAYWSPTFHQLVISSYRDPVLVNIMTINRRINTELMSDLHLCTHVQADASSTNTSSHRLKSISLLPCQK